MTKLRAPLNEHLTPRVDERAIQRIWAGVRRQRGGSWFVRHRVVSAWGLGFAAAFMVLAVLVSGWRWRATPSPVVGAQVAGQLLSRVGGTLSVLGGEPASQTELSDGSSIDSAPGSRLEVLENTAKTFVSILRTGSGTFAVRPGGPRRWTVEAGLATVEVAGTQFTVTRTPGNVEVSVEHGIVLVRSELIQDRVQRLTAGQRLAIHAPAPEPIPSLTVAGAGGGRAEARAAASSGAPSGRFDGNSRPASELERAARPGRRATATGRRTRRRSGAARGVDDTCQ